MSGFTQRLAFSALPESVVSDLERAIGASVVGARDVHGGMSAGPAAVLDLDDGRTVFAKVNSRELNERSYQLYADEVAVYAALDDVADLPRPELFAAVTTGPWIALLLSLAPGQAAGPPWRPRALEATWTTLTTLAGRPAPAGLPPARLRLPDLDGWAVLATSPPAPLDAWDERHASACADLSEGWREWTAGAALAHHDCRCDNAVVDDETAVVTLVDWNFACAGAAWLDLALFATDVVASGIEGRSDDDAVVAAVGVLDALPFEATRFSVALAGMMRRNSLLPPHAGLPTFRSWQARRADRLRLLVEAVLTD